MEFSDMLDVANAVKARRKPKNAEERTAFTDELTGDIEQVIDHLESLTEIARELRDSLSEAQQAETATEFNALLPAIKDQAESLADMFNGVE